MGRAKDWLEEASCRLKTFVKSYRCEILGGCLIIFICILHALSAGHDINFNPINGTFQNYNPIRRMLSGQIPYKEFHDYLGMGHLYTGALLTAIFGGDYQGSLIAFSFLSFAGLSAISLMIGKSVFKSGKVVIYMTIIVELLLLTQPLFFVNALGFTEEVFNALCDALGTGNSARFVRGFILPVCIGLGHICDFAYNKHIFKKDSRIKKWIPDICAGIIAGFGFIWSNDYGISCWLCICIVMFWVSLSRNRKVIHALVDMLVVFGISVMSVFVFVEVFTLGHFTSWLKTTFGTGRYQSWYYNSSKSYYLYDVDFSFIMLLQAVMAIAYLVMVFYHHGSREAIKRYGILGFANMTCFCAVNEYKLLSGGDSREVALSVLFLTILFEIIHMLGGLCRNRRFVRNFIAGILVVSEAWCISAIKEEAAFYISGKNGEWVESMGGYMTDKANDLNETSRFLNGENFWSTYASAQEVVENKFQPSGTDYIIHVLGDESRDNYMDAFRSGDFKYVATIRKDFDEWEYWVERANWFFYRELYRGWHPVFSNSYETYWARNDMEDEYTLHGEYDIQLQMIDESTVKLIIETDESISGVADVYIDYSVDKKPDNRSAKLLFQRLLRVTNTGAVTAKEAYFELNYLRADGAEYVPMPITNGYGELTLAALPGASTILNIRETRCDTIYAVGHMTKLADVTDENWSAGVSASGTELLFHNSDILLRNFGNAGYLQANGETFEIIKAEPEGDWIRVEVDKNASACAFPEIITIRGADNE